MLGDKALPSIEIIPKEGFYNYANKYQPRRGPMRCVPARIPKEWEKAVGEAALAVFQTIGLSVYARADLSSRRRAPPTFWRSIPCPA